jgi:hypothetical protein
MKHMFVRGMSTTCTGFQTSQFGANIRFLKFRVALIRQQMVSDVMFSFSTKRARCGAQDESKHVCERHVHHLHWVSNIPIWS